MRLLVTHTLPPGLTREELDGLAKATQADPNIKGLTSYMNLTQHKAACVFDAPNREALAKWMDDNQLPYDDIWQVELEGTRGEFHEVEPLVSAVAAED